MHNIVSYGHFMAIIVENSEKDPLSLVRYDY